MYNNYYLKMKLKIISTTKNNTKITKILVLRLYKHRRKIFGKK